MHEIINNLISYWNIASDAALFPAEQARIVHLLVGRVTVDASGIAVDLRNEGLGSVLRDMMAPRQTEVCA